MKYYLIILCLIVLISIIPIISSQNETNVSLNNSEATNLTGFCGDGIIQIELGEECDLGLNNTDNVCVASYGQECNYCDTACKNKTILGGSCGDKRCQSEKEDYKNCPTDNCPIPPKDECNFDSDCKEKPNDNLCTENVCQGEPKTCRVNKLNSNRINGDKYYCLNGNLENQKSDDSMCAENWECKSNMCSEGKCLRMRKGFIQNLLESFGLSRLYDKLKEWGIL